MLVHSAEEVVRSNQVVVVAYESEEFRSALAEMNGTHHLIDLSGVDLTGSAAEYEGIAW